MVLFHKGGRRQLFSHLSHITAAIKTCVWIIFICINTTIFDDELEGIVHESTIASLVVRMVTVHQLLLRERKKFTSLDCIDTLNCSYC